MWIISNKYRYWYSPLIPEDQSFVSACRATLSSFLTSFSSHLSRKRPADTFLDFLTNASSITIVFLSELSSALATARTADLSNAESLSRYLEENPSSSLATVLDVEQQDRKLHAVAEDILQKFLAPKAYTFDPARTFLKEVLSTLVLKATITTCSKPDFLNIWIIYLLEDAPASSDEDVADGVESAAGAPSETMPKDGIDLHYSKGFKSETPTSPKQRSESHRRTVSRAEEAMEEAMQEAKRLTDLIAAEEEKRTSHDQASSTTSASNHELTPTSSVSDLVSNPTTIGEKVHDHSLAEAPVQSSTPSATAFTTFDEMLPSFKPTALSNGASASPPPPPPPLTLHKASVSIFDDATPGEKSTLKSKPTIDYLLQIEPALSIHPGWMIPRKYSDFEVLHETLRTVAKISGVPEFNRSYDAVPAWKGQTKSALRSELETYLRITLSYNPLAESDAMKRFLDKEQGQGKASSGTNKGLGFAPTAAFDVMGKGVLDVSKGIAGGGKAVFGGVAGVFGAGQKKRPQTQAFPNGSANQSRTSLSRNDSSDVKAPSSMARPSQDFSRSSTPYSRSLNDGTDTPKSDLQPSIQSGSAEGPANKVSASSRKFTDLYSRPPDAPERRQSESHENTDVRPNDSENFSLPPPPSEMPDNYGVNGTSIAEAASAGNIAPPRDKVAPSDPPTVAQSSDPNPTPTNPSNTIEPHIPTSTTNPSSSNPNPPSKPPTHHQQQHPPLTTQETTLTIELFFLLTTQLYTLSSAWSLRRTLLTAAKNFLLRPQNPQLEALRTLLQTTLLDSNTSPEGIASHIDTLRKTALPTEEELREWEKVKLEEARKRIEKGEGNEEEMEERRKKARRLLVEKGMPGALVGVMGSAATGEALGKVFDCLQVEEVSRGLVFAVGVQVLRALVV